jgi:ribonucleoside-triphosphate reductase
MRSERPDVARAYIRYRYKKEVARNFEHDFIDAVVEKLEASDVQNQNANIDEHSFGGRTGEATGVMTKRLALDHLMSEKSRENHLNNRIYIHDLDAYYVGSHNCLSIPFDDLLAKGFNTRQTDVRPAGSVNTACQLVAVIFQLQSLQQFGGVSATHIDWTMVPYIRKSFYKHFCDGMKYIEDGNTNCAALGLEPKDISIVGDFYKSFSNCEKAYEYAMDMTEKEVHQAVEGLYHNLNTLQSRSGNQLPFTSINYGTCTLPEGRMFTKALLEVSIEGLGRLHKTSIFPCGIFQCMKDVNREPGDPNYDLYRLALESTSRRLYPNYANVDWSGNAGYDRNNPETYFSTMGCRTVNGADINAEPGVNPQTKDGRGNICPVTIIMPTLAMEAKEKEGNIVENFMIILDEAIHDARDMLIERYNWICSQDASSAKFMYENNVMRGYHPEQGIRSALQHGTIVIGQLGLAETLQILIGCDHTEPRGMELAKRIEALFKQRCAEFKKEYHLNFGVYYTPAENLCYTALKKFREKYGVMENISDKDFFTNSMHVPVWHKLSPFDKIDIESQLTGYSNAGCITYVELDASVVHNPDALEQIVNYAMDKDIPYFAVNVPSDTCLSCGYTGEVNDKCPMCGSEKVQHLRRVTGYLTGDYKTAFNFGKQDEVHHRIKHTGQMEQ